MDPNQKIEWQSASAVIEELLDIIEHKALEDAWHSWQASAARLDAEFCRNGSLAVGALERGLDRTHVRARTMAAWFIRAFANEYPETVPTQLHDRTAQVLVDGLKSTDMIDRIWVCMLLGIGHAPKAAIHELRTIMASADTEMQSFAAVALTSLGELDAKTVGALTRGLRSDNPSIVALCAHAASKLEIRTEELIIELERAILIASDASMPALLLAVQSCKKQMSDGLVHAVIKVIEADSRYEDVRGMAARTLGSVAPNNAGAIRALRRLASSGNPHLVQRAIEGYGESEERDHRFVALVDELLVAEDEELRVSALRGLGSAPSLAGELTETLIGRMNQESRPATVEALAKALGKAGKMSRSRVVDIVVSGDVLRRQCAMDALTWMGAEGAEALVVAAVACPSGSSLEAVIEVVRMIGPKARPLAERLGQLLEASTKEEVAGSLVVAIAELEDAAAVCAPALVSCLVSASEELAPYPAAALRQLGPMAHPAIRARLEATSGPQRERLEALLALPVAPDSQFEEFKSVPVVKLRMLVLVVDLADADGVVDFERMARELKIRKANRRLHPTLPVSDQSIGNYVQSLKGLLKHLLGDEELIRGGGKGRKDKTITASTRRIALRASQYLEWIDSGAGRAWC